MTTEVITATDPEQMIRNAQAAFVRFRNANLLEKPALAEKMMQGLLDAMQLLAADVRIIRDGR